VCRLLLERKEFTGVNAKDFEEHTVLHRAVIGDHLSVCQLLCNEDITVNKFSEADAADKSGSTALHLAAQRHGNVDIVRVVLAHQGFTAADFKDKGGRTALHFTAAKKPADEEKGLACCRELMESKLFNAVNEKDGTGFTVLHMAALKGLKTVCKYIMENPRFTAKDAKDVQGRTAKALATRDARHSLIMTLS